MRRAAWGLGLCAVLVLGVALRLHTKDAVAPGGRVRPFDSDSAYHLRRARFAVERYPRTILFDPMMNFPEGGVPIWPPLYDVLLATPARLIHGAKASAGEIAGGAAWVPIALGAGAILLAGSLGRRLRPGAGGGRRAAGLAAAAFVAAAFVAVCPAHILWTQYGHTDQHAAESFCGLAALVFFLRCREKPASAGNARREAAAGLALALAVLTWQGAIYWGAIFALALVLEAARGTPVLRAAFWTLGFPAAAVGAATLAWLSWLRPPFTYVSFGFFQPILLAALCGGAAALGLAARAMRRRAARSEVVGTLLLVAAAASLTLPFASELVAGAVNGIGYVAGRTSEAAAAGGYASYPKDWLKGIFEARPLLADGPGLAWRQLSAASFLAPLAALVWADRARRGLRPGVHGALAIWAVVTLFLALSQRLNVYYAAPLAALTLVEAARQVSTRIARAGRTLRRIPRWLAATAAGFALALPMVPGLQEELRSDPVPGSDLFETLDWMRDRVPHGVDAYDPKLLGPPPFPESLRHASAVLGPWSLGHLVLEQAELPVVANNFGYGFLESIRFFLAPTEDEALAIARRHRARWVVATDLVPRVNDYASYLGRPPLIRETPGGQVPSAAYFSTLQSRLYDFEGRGGSLPGLEVAPLTHFRLVHRSQSAIRRGGRWIARWAVFEILEDNDGAQGAGAGGGGGPDSP